MTLGISNLLFEEGAMKFEAVQFLWVREQVRVERSFSQATETVLQSTA